MLCNYVYIVMFMQFISPHKNVEYCFFYKEYYDNCKRAKEFWILGKVLKSVYLPPLEFLNWNMEKSNGGISPKVEETSSQEMIEISKNN